MLLVGVRLSNKNFSARQGTAYFEVLFRDVQETHPKRIQAIDIVLDCLHEADVKALLILKKLHFLDKGFRIIKLVLTWKALF